MKFFVLILCCAAFVLGAAPPEKLAVAEPQTAGGVTAAEIAGLAHFLEAKLGNEFVLYSRASLRQLLAEFEFNQSGLVLDDQAKTQLRQQGVKYLLTSTVTRAGNRLLAVLTLIDAETGRILPDRRAAVEAANFERLYPRLEQALKQMKLLNQAPEEPKRLALLPGRTPSSAAAGLFDDEVATFLLKAGSFELLTREDLGLIQAESALAESALAAPGQQIKVGGLQVADYLAILDLNRFERTVKSPGTAIAGNAAPRLQFHGDATIRLIEVADGRVLAVEPVDCFYESIDIPAAVRRNWTDRDYDRELARRLAETAGRALLARLDPILVAVVDGRTLTLTRGEGAGVKPGQLYTVFNPGRTVVNPRTGRPLGTTEKLAGEARIVNVSPGLATAEMLPGATPVEPGAECRLKSAPEPETTVPAYPRAQ